VAHPPEDYQLLGTIAWDQPFSMAIISSKTSGKTGVYRVKDKIVEDTEVVTIERKKVTIVRAGKQEVLNLPEIEIQTAKLNVSKSNVGDGEIKQTSETDFVVSKDVIDKQFLNPMGMMKGAKVVPHFEKGGIAGFQISNIRADSLYGKIGLKNGDVVRRINNIEIKGPEEALKLMTELKEAKNVNMDITRDGKRMSYSYSVR
jgi:general secretion pathway protein C